MSERAGLPGQRLWTAFHRYNPAVIQLPALRMRLKDLAASRGPLWISLTDRQLLCIAERWTLHVCSSEEAG